MCYGGVTSANFCRIVSSAVPSEGNIYNEAHGYRQSARDTAGGYLRYRTQAVRETRGQDKAERRGRRMLSELSDHQLVCLIEQGSITAFEELYDRALNRDGPTIRRVLRTTVARGKGARRGTPDDVECILYDTLAALWKAIRDGRLRLGPEEQVTGYLIGIAGRLACKHEKSRRKQAQDSKFNIVRAATSDRNTAADVAAEREMIERVEAACLMIEKDGDPRLREVVKLLKTSDIGCVNIGRKLGISRSKAHRLMAKVIEELRRLIIGASRPTASEDTETVEA
jgi:DNA-directed RNA polymerase specialized sigma24 family protein